MRQERIVDAHHHLWQPDPGAGDPWRGYPWMVGPAAVLRREFNTAHLHAELATAGVSATVLVFLCSSDHYLEFGAGGSTCIAARLVRNAVTAVDSSAQWLRDVEQACSGEDCRVKPVMFHVDIGPTGAWGRPVDPSTQSRWPSYYEAVWERPASSGADLYLVDGRFRVACFMNILLSCRSDAVVMIHDYASRAQYHVISQVAREVARAEDFSAFVCMPGQSRAALRAILAAYRLNPD